MRAVPEVRARKKLIEVALTLDAVNEASAREKFHPPRAFQHAASVVGAPAARGGTCGDLRADGRRPVRVRRSAAVRPEDSTGRPTAAPTASGGVREPTCRSGRGGLGFGADAGGGGRAAARAPVQAHRRLVQWEKPPTRMCWSGPEPIDEFQEGLAEWAAREADEVYPFEPDGRVLVLYSP